MGFLDRFKPGYVDWRQAFVAVPKAYKKEDGSIFGTVALSEHTQTVLPRQPQDSFKLGEMGEIYEWRLVLVSTTRKGVIGECNYFKALQKLKKYTEDVKPDAILVRELTLPELESLIESPVND